MFRFDRSKSKNLFQLDAPEKDEEGFGISEVPRISLFGSEKNQKILQKNSKKIPIPEQRRPNGTENLDSSLKARWSFHAKARAITQVIGTVCRGGCNRRHRRMVTVTASGKRLQICAKPLSLMPKSQIHAVLRGSLRF